MKKSLTEIKSWLSKNKTQILDKKKIGIVELSNSENIDDFLLNLGKLETDIKISIINLSFLKNKFRKQGKIICSR